MKKCPQCGTILEETKKKCYMCGAELQKKSFVDFGDTFDEQIGATVTNGQNNALNNIGNVMSGAEGAVSNNGQVTFANSMNSADQVQENVAPSLPSKYDNRTAIEKIFSTDARYKKDALDFEGSGNDDFSNNPQCFESSPMVPLPPVSKDDEEKKTKKKPSINWGNNLKNSYSDDDNEPGRSKKIGFNTIFNIFSIIVFLVSVIFLYFKFLAPKDEFVGENFGGLYYEIDSDFMLESESGGSRYYTYGSECALKVSFGPTVETQGFLDSYFEKVKNSNKNSQVSTTDMTINGNSWTEIRVFDFEQNAASQNGFSEMLKYKYVAIVHKGNFYDIVFANDKDDNRCAAMFDKFQGSLTLK